MTFFCQNPFLVIHLQFRSVLKRGINASIRSICLNLLSCIEMAPFKYLLRNSMARIGVLVSFSVFVFWDYGAISAVVIASFLLIFPTIVFTFPNRNAKALLEKSGEENLCGSVRRNDKSEPVLLEPQPENAKPETVLEQQPEKCITLCESLRRNDKPEPLLEQQPENGINLCESLRRNDKPNPLLEQQSGKGIITEELSRLNAGDIVADQKNGNGIDHFQEHMVNPPELLYSESESNGLQSSSEDSDVDWLCSAQSPDYSDESISDEEGLIEIEIPSLNYDVEDPNLFFEYKKPQDQFLALKQHSLMDNEMNEEDNLIEIDISIGSIKFSSFEIEA